MAHVVHVSSVHSRTDTRIFLKECRTLAANGYNTTFVVADGLPDEKKDGVFTLGVDKEKNRLRRMLMSPIRLSSKLRSMKADLFHFHDPELIPLALRMKALGYKVVFDFHEDVAMQILSKPYMGRGIKRQVSKAYSILEKYALPKFDLIITATPHIKEKLSKINANTIDINNYPLLGELDSCAGEEKKAPIVAYVGNITEIRGIRQMVEALDYCRNDVVLYLGGKFKPGSLRNEIQLLPGWRRVKELGFINRGEVQALLSKARVGLVLFLPEPNHIHSQPNKMFEYLSAGLPIVASNFTTWKKIIEGKNCGLCVDPLNPKEIAGAIDWLLDNPEIASDMGNRGRLAVMDEFNWSAESKKLIMAYNDLLGCSNRDVD